MFQLRNLATVTAVGLAMALGGHVQANTLLLQQGVSPDATYEHRTMFLRDIGTSAEGSFLVGSTQDNETLRSIVEFDLAPLAAVIGQDDWVEAVSFAVYINQSGGNLNFDGDPSVDVHLYDHILPASPTWNNPGIGDATPGGTAGTYLTTWDNFELVTDEEAGYTISGGNRAPIHFFRREVETSATLVAAIEAALAPGGSGTLSFILVETPSTYEDGSRDILFLRSSTHSNEELRPELHITYVPEPASVVLMGMGAGLLLLRRRNAA